MKTKVLLTMGAMMAFAISVMAGPVSKAEALAQARSFMQSKGIQLTGDLAVTSGPKRAMASRDESSCYYIFNNGQNGGFVIVSGDDRTRDILGYSDTGAMDMDNLPDNVRYMLDCFESEINELRCNFSCYSDHGGFLFLPKSHQFSPIPSKLSLSPIFCLGRMASHPAAPVSLSFLLSTLARCFSNSLSHHALGFM